MKVGDYIRIRKTDLPMTHKKFKHWERSRTILQIVEIEGLSVIAINPKRPNMRPMIRMKERDIELAEPSRFCGQKGAPPVDGLAGPEDAII